MIKFVVKLILIIITIIFSINLLISLSLYYYATFILEELEGLTLGQAAFSATPAGLNLVQSITERYIGPWLWDSYFVFFLLKTITYNIIFWAISLVIILFIDYYYFKRLKRRKHFFR